MKFLVMLMLTGIALLSAAEKGSPDVIHWDGDNIIDKVQETGHLEIFSTADPRSAPNRDADSTAERLAEPGKRFVWIPTEDNSRGAGGAKIPDVSISADQSALFILETVGADNGPFDTRLVILDTQTGEIGRVLRFAKVRYTRILTLPDTDDLLLIRPPEGKKQIIDLADPVSGKIRRSHSFPEFSDLLIMGDQLLVKQKYSPLLSLVDRRTLHPENEIKTTAKGGILLPESPDIVNIVYPGNPAKLERIPMPGSPAIHNEDDILLTLPAGFSPEKGLLFGNTRSIQLWLKPGGDAMFRIGKTFHHLAERINGLAVYNRKTQSLFLGLQKRDMLAEFQPEKSTDILRSTITGQLKPRTRGEMRAIFSCNSAKSGVYVLDHRANFYLLQPPTKGRSWKKFILFTPGK